MDRSIIHIAWNYDTTYLFRALTHFQNVDHDIGIWHPKFSIQLVKFGGFVYTAWQPLKPSSCYFWWKLKIGGGTFFDYYLILLLG